MKIYAFDQNPPGKDKGNEWVALYNPENYTVDISEWKLKTRCAGGRKIVTIPEEANRKEKESVKQLYNL